ncbi:hypothetical protein, partial [Streptomyces sp. SID3343]|uniref:hypothetical protein n=1 Tax=Streptomyces sp. SID3343 TaxID=2690260 RepID=UPI0013C27893
MRTLEGTSPAAANLAGASGNEPKIFVAGLVLLVAGALLALAGRHRFADTDEDLDLDLDLDPDPDLPTPAP